MDHAVGVLHLGRHALMRRGIAHEPREGIVHVENLRLRAHDDALRGAFDDAAHLRLGAAGNRRLVAHEHKPHGAVVLRGDGGEELRPASRPRAQRNFDCGAAAAPRGPELRTSSKTSASSGWIWIRTWCRRRPTPAQSVRRSRRHRDMQNRAVPIQDDRRIPRSALDPSSRNSLFPAAICRAARCRFPRPCRR
jgi:hypothetical protein